MIPKEVIDELKQSHPELWAQKRAVLTEQQTAQVILAQIEIDKANPPHLEAVAQAKRLIVMVNAKGAEFQRLKGEVIERIKALGEHADLIDVEFISAEGLPTAADDQRIADLERLLAEHSELVTRQAERITELEGLLEASVKQLKLERDQAIGERDAFKSVNETQRLKLEKAEADLKAAQDALQKPVPKAKK
jgi:hypothetical protein